MSRLGEAAEAYARILGLHIFGLREGDKIPLPGSHGRHDASCDPAVIAAQWEKTPNANIGLALEQSGLCVLDVDPRNSGDESFERLTQRFGPLPASPVQRSGSGGNHFVFRGDPRITRGKLAAEGFPGIDIIYRGHIVVAPSVHPSGATYEWMVSPRSVAPPPMPEWLLEMVTRADGGQSTGKSSDSPPGQDGLADLAVGVSQSLRRPSCVRSAPPDAVRRGALWARGCRPSIEGQGGDDQLWSVARGLVVGFMLGEEGAWPLIAEWNLRCEPPWPVRDLRRALHRAATVCNREPGYLLNAERRGR